MKRIFVSVKHLRGELICVGLVADSGQKFYAESSQFSGSFPGDFTFCFDPPGPNEDEHWMWTKGNDVEMRGTNKEISKNIKDWFQSLSDGALSWVDYSESSGGIGYRNIRPNIDFSDYLLYFKTLIEYDIFQNIWTFFPYPILNSPIILKDLDVIYKDIPNLEEFTQMFHLDKNDRPIDNCLILKSYITTVLNIQKSHY